MTLKDETKAVTRTQGPKCVISRVLPELSEEDRSDLLEMLDPLSGYQHVAIAEALKGRDFHIPDGAVQRHRRKKCSCYARPVSAPIRKEPA
jgi:hypothetical protein